MYNILIFLIAPIRIIIYKIINYLLHQIRNQVNFYIKEYLDDIKTQWIEDNKIIDFEVKTGELKKKREEKKKFILARQNALKDAEEWVIKTIPDFNKIVNDWNIAYYNFWEYLGSWFLLICKIEALILYLLCYPILCFLGIWYFIKTIFQYIFKKMYKIENRRLKKNFFLFSVNSILNSNKVNSHYCFNSLLDFKNFYKLPNLNVQCLLSTRKTHIGKRLILNRWVVRSFLTKYPLKNFKKSTFNV